MRNAVTLMVLSALIGVALVPGVVSAQQNGSEWVFIAQNSDNTDIYSGKRGSYELTSTKGGEQIAMVLGQIEEKKTKDVSYAKWYVTTAHCEAGLGKLVILKIDGEFNAEIDYVAKGKNIASGIGDLICGIYLSNKEAKESKGV